MKKQWSSQYERMTCQPVPSLVLQLAGPSVVSMIISTVYNMVDTFFVARLGTEAVAAVGVSFSINEAINSFGYLFGTGAGTLMGILLGEKKQEEASRLGSTSFFTAEALGILIAVFGLIFLSPLMRFLGSSEAVLPYATRYAFWILIAFPIMCGVVVLGSFLRSEGKMRQSMTGVATGGLLNMALDPLFIFTLNLGITGAALATAVSQLISLCILLFFYLTGRTEVRLSVMRITPSISAYRRILVTGFPSLCRHGIITFATIAMNTAAGMYGGDVMIAALAIVNKVTSFIQSLLKGVFQGAQAIYSYNKGAGRYDRVRKAYRFSLAFNTVLVSLIAAAMFFAAGGIISLFNAEDPAVLEIGAWALTVETCSLFFMPLDFSGNMLLQSVNEPLQSTALALLPQGLFYIPFVFLLPLFMGRDGVIWAMTAGQVLTAVVTVPVVRKYFKGIPQ